MKAKELLWRVSHSFAPTKAWVSDCTGKSISLLMNRNTAKKLVDIHNKSIELLKPTRREADKGE